MNKHTKLVVLALTALLVLLVVATVSYSLDISRDAESSDGNSVDSNGNQIMQGEEDLYGVVDSAGNTLIEAEWAQLRFISTQYLAAVQTDGSSNQVGVIDLDGHVVAPFVYTDIYALTPSYFVAVLSETEQIVLYDSDFHAIYGCVWDAYTWSDQILTLTSGSDTFTFSLEDSAITAQHAALMRTAGRYTFTTSLDEAAVAQLVPDEWSYIADLIQNTLMIFQSQNVSTLDAITDAAHNDAVLQGMMQTDGVFEQFNARESTLYAEVQTAVETGEKTVIWQTSARFRKTEGVSVKTVQVTVSRNQEQMWVVTNFEVV